MPLSTSVSTMVNRFSSGRPRRSCACPAAFAQLPSIVDDAAWPARRTKLQQCIDDKNTCYYGFEANPSFDETLDAIERTLRDAGRPVKLFTRTAFNINDNRPSFL